MRLRHTTFVAATAAALLLLSSVASPVQADTEILQYGGDPGTVTATGNGSTGVTTIVASGTDVSITSIGGVNLGSSPILAYLTLSATSTGTAMNSGGLIQQTFSGTFEITQNADGSGTNYLSATFTGLTFGIASSGGGTATLSSTDPPYSIAYTSNYSPALLLSPPSAASFTFTGINPGFGTVGTGSDTTIGSFTASSSGDFSASPEPSSMAIACLGALGLIGYGLRRRKALGA